MVNIGIEPRSAVMLWQKIFWRLAEDAARAAALGVDAEPLGLGLVGDLLQHRTLWASPGLCAELARDGSAGEAARNRAQE